MRLILASQSPRRARLLRQLGIQFQIIPSKVDESIHLSNDPVRTARQLALAKALSVSTTRNQGIIIGADTIVVINHKILGKPKDQEHARWLLSQLSGRTHQVITAVAVIDAASNKKKVGHCITSVRFRKLTKHEIEVYLATGDQMDKAGSYGIQGKGALFIESIHGDYFNVVGLPLVLLFRLLRSVLSQTQVNQILTKGKREKGKIGTKGNKTNHKGTKYKKS